MTYTDQLTKRLVDAGSESARIQALIELSRWLASADPRSAVIKSREALAAAENHGEPSLLAQAHRVHAQSALFTGSPRAAYDELRDTRERCAELSDADEAAWCELFLGVALEFLGDPGGATIQLDRAVTGFRLVDDLAGEAHVLNSLANGQFVVGQFDRAFESLREARDIAVRSTDPAAIGMTSAKIGEVRARRGVLAMQSGRPDEARSQLATALHELREAYDYSVGIGYLSLEPSCLANQVLPLVWLGRGDEAVEVAERALARAGELDLDHRAANALHHAGMAYMVGGEACRAIGYLERADALYEQWDLTHDTVAVLRLLVQAYERGRDIPAALAAHKRLLNAELRLRDHIAERADQIAVARFEAERTREVSEEGRLRLQQLTRVNRRLADERRAMERLAHTDPLTGLANRRYFDAQCARMLVQSELSGEPVTVILVDVDFFKRINDNYSHLVGDGVLCAIATELARHCRVTDLACRIGGEEFAILLPATNASEAMAVAQRLRVSVAELDIERQAPGLSTTVSAGVASVVGGDSVSMIAAADKALYRAKAAGRNRVFFAEEPTDQSGREPVTSVGPIPT